MADYPDGVQVVQVAVTVANQVVLPAPSSERVAGGIGRYAGTSGSYQPVVIWTVATGKQGKLSEVSMVSDTYPKTLFQLIVGGVTFMTEKTIKTALSLPFNDLLLAAGAVTTLSARSSDGANIIVDGSVVAKEVG